MKGIGAAGIAGLAGCLGGGGDEETTDTTTDGGEETTTESSGSGGSQQRDPIKYGVLLPLTGDLGSTGQLMKDAAVLPTTQLNDGGDLDVQIDSQVADSQTDPSSAISAANSLLNSGYPAAAGPASSGVNIQVSKQVFIPNGMVGVSPSSTAPTVTNLEDDGYVFRTAPSDALQGQVMAQVASGRLEGQSASSLYVNNDYGQLLSQSFFDSFEGEAQQKVSFEKEQPSYTSKLQSALSNDPDVLIVIGYPASGIQLFKDFYADFGDSDTQILVTDGLQDPSMQKQIGNPMNNVTGTAPKPAGPNADAFASMYQEQYGTSPGVFNSHSYDAAAVIILANAMAGENSGEAIRDNMQKVANPGGKEIGPDNLAEGVTMAMNGEDINYQGASSSVDFDDNGDMKAVTYSVWEFAPDTESGIEEVDTINFGGESGSTTSS